MHIGTKIALVATLSASALSGTAQESIDGHEEFQGYVSTEVTFAAADEKLYQKRKTLKALFQQAKIAADSSEHVELTARLDSYAPTIDAMTFEDVFQPLNLQSDQFSLIVSVDAGHGDTLPNIMQEVENFVASLSLPEAAYVDFGGTYYITGCGEAIPLNANM